MAIIQKGLDVTKWVKNIKTQRLCNCVYFILTKYHSELNIPLHMTGHGGQKMAINDALEKSELPEDSKRNIIDSVVNYANELLLPDSEFDWLSKSNEHLYRWCFYYLVLNRQMEATYCTSYSDYKLSIVKYFDNAWLHKTDQLALLKELKCAWQYCYKDEIKIDWLDKNAPEQIDWSFNYLSPTHVFNHQILIGNQQDKYWAVILSINYWKEHPAAKREFVRKMKNAWNKNSTRKNSSRKKQFNYIMDADIENKINYLKDIKGLSKSKIVEDLINLEYSKIKDQNI